MRTGWMLLMGTTGCGDKSGDTGSAGSAPDIAVDVSEIAFGEVSAGGASERILISNDGAADLNISSVYLTFGEESFTLQPLSTDTVPPGGSVGLTVDFVPPGPDEVADTVVIASDDPDEPAVEIAVSGAGLAAGLSADAVDFGPVYAGCSELRSLTVENIDLSAIDLTAISFAEGTVFDASSEPLPVTLQPGESTTLTLSYGPESLGSHTDTLILTSSSSAAPTLDVALSGQGSSAGEQLDDFSGSLAPVELLIFADQSCSMDDNNLQLALSFSDFADQLNDLGIDWQVAALTEDDGCANAVLNPATPNLGSTFQNALTNNSGGIYTEALLTLLNRSLSSAEAGECNEGLIREGAAVHAVMLSDEPEQSSGTWSSHVTSAENAAADLGASSLTISAIAGDLPSGCGGGVGSADAGIGYYEATQETGGYFYSICGDFSEHLTDLAENLSTSASAFPLSEAPLAETITVTVGGSQKTQGWSYSEESNTVIFDSPPKTGAEIEVSYERAGTCE